MSIEWTNELTLDLIQEYRKEELLWNPSNNLYKNLQLLKIEKLGCLSLGGTASRKFIDFLQIFSLIFPSRNL